MFDNIKELSPDEQKIIEIQREAWKQRHGMPDEDFNKFISLPAHRKMSLRTEEMRRYKLIAEVVRSKYCNMGVKVGQKFVFRVMPSKFIPEESDCPLCIKALGPMGQIMLGFWDRFVQGDDVNGNMWTHYQCLDPGVDNGGLGNVLFKVTAVKQP